MGCARLGKRGQEVRAERLKVDNANLLVEVLHGSVKRPGGSMVGRQRRVVDPHLRLRRGHGGRNKVAASCRSIALLGQLVGLQAEVQLLIHAPSLALPAVAGNVQAIAAAPRPVQVQLILAPGAAVANVNLAGGVQRPLVRLADRPVEPALADRQQRPIALVRRHGLRRDEELSAAICRR